MKLQSLEAKPQGAAWFQHPCPCGPQGALLPTMLVALYLPISSCTS